MNGALSSEAIDVGDMVRERLAAEGGIALLRESVTDPARRHAIGDMLGELGLWEIDPASSAMELEVAAEVCRAAGEVALPYPVVERLGAVGAEMTTLISRSGRRIAQHLDLGLAWNAIDLTGSLYAAAAENGALVESGSQLAPFGTDAVVTPANSRDARGVARLITLQSWWLIGLMQRAHEATVRYTNEREQFGRHLSRFQAVGFRLADMTMELAMTDELGKYTLWMLATSGDDDEVLTEALGLRVAALRAADVVLRGAHQLHGAMGFTDEVEVSWLSRASQAARRLPEDSHRTAELARTMLERVGYAELGHATPRNA